MVRKHTLEITPWPRRGAGMSEQWYFCLKHMRVEKDAACPYSEALGPYDTYEEAARALETAQERNEAWDNDPRWRDDDD